MNTIIIDTTKKQAIIVLLANNKHKVVNMPKDVQHSESLLVYLEELISSENLTVQNINNFCVVTGPGSFTGLRVGLSCIKAFHASLNIYLFGANIFEIVANYVINGMVLLNCTSTTYYYGEIKNGKVVGYGVINKKEILNNNGNLFIISNDENFEELANAKIIKNYESLIIEHFQNLLKKNKPIEVNALQPFYIQVSQAERDLEKKEVTIDNNNKSN